MTKNGKVPIKDEAVEPRPVRRPDYIADGVAIWFNKDKNDKVYLAIKIVGHTTLYARENLTEEPAKPPEKEA